MTSNKKIGYLKYIVGIYIYIKSIIAILYPKNAITLVYDLEKITKYKKLLKIIRPEVVCTPKMICISGRFCLTIGKNKTCSK